MRYNRCYTAMHVMGMVVKIASFAFDPQYNTADLSAEPVI